MNKVKITLKLDWVVAGTGRVRILNATYAQALRYACYLRRGGAPDTIKPVVV